MELLTIFMGIGLVFAIVYMYVLTREVDFFKKKALERTSDMAYFKKSYIKYYDKYVELTRPEIVH